MIWPILASLLGLADTVIAVVLQRSAYRELGPLSYFFGQHPKPWQFALGYVVITAMLWGLYYGVGRWVVVPWIVVEAYEGVRNWRLLHQ